MTRRRAFVLVALVSAGCGGGRHENAADRGRAILRIAYEREIDVLNPFTSQNLVDISFSMIEGLVTTDDRNRYVPVLARPSPPSRTASWSARRTARWR